VLESRAWGAEGKKRGISGGVAARGSRSGSAEEKLVEMNTPPNLRGSVKW